MTTDVDEEFVAPFAEFSRSGGVRFLPADYGPPRNSAPRKEPIKATQFAYRDPHTIPPRQFLFGKHYVRGFVSTTVSPGGIGKTSQAFVEAASMVSGEALLGIAPSGPLRVWLINLEDPLDELERRMAAVLKHYCLGHEAIEGRLFIDSGRDVPIKLAHKARDEIVVAEPIVAEIIEEIRARAIDVLVIDPFVSSHNVPENDNGAIDRVVKTWARVADETGCAVELVHHVRKPANGSQSEFTVDDARGAVALIGAVRSARVLNVMSEEDALKSDVPPEDRRSYFRVDNGKSNMAPPVDKAVWRKLVGVPLDNDTDDHPGDWVGVVTAWTMPGAFDDVSTTDLRNVQKRIADGDWAENIQAGNWAGLAVGEVLDLDARSAAGKQKIKTLLATWIKNKALRVEVQHSARDGRDRPMIVVGERI